MPKTLPRQTPYSQSSLFGEPIGPRHPVVGLELLKHTHEVNRFSRNNPIITHGQQYTRFGLLTLVSCEDYILHVHLGDQISEGISSMQRMFPGCDFQKSDNTFLTDLVNYLEDPAIALPVFRLKVSATPFQYDVWSALLSIPLGRRVSYAGLANSLGRPDAVRAVGTAVGRNPIAFLIPCHRVVHSDGRTGQYMWGGHRKEEILRWEARLTDSGG